MKNKQKIINKFVVEQMTIEALGNRLKRIKEDLDSACDVFKGILARKYNCLKCENMKFCMPEQYKLFIVTYNSKKVYCKNFVKVRTNNIDRHSTKLAQKCRLWLDRIGKELNDKKQ